MKCQDKRGKNLHGERFCVNCNCVRTFKYKFKEKHSICIFCGGWKAKSIIKFPKLPKKSFYHYYPTYYLKQVVGLFSDEIAKRRRKNVKR